MFTLSTLSDKQKQLLLWWHPGSGVDDRRFALADGAIRSGKTVAMILSFLWWSLSTFSEGDFIIAGKTGGTLRRNVLTPMFRILEHFNIPYVWKRTEACVRIGGNTYHLFGAENEGSQDKLQGMTASGAYADEAALFPRSFIDQMIGRCSVSGSRIFMNCNPENSFHYIKTDFIDRASQIGLYRLHFTMDDNPSLSKEIRESYARSFCGVFYDRNILGRWVSAEGAIYPMWDDTLNTYTETSPQMYDGMRRYVSVDYGTVNPCVFLDIRDNGRVFYIANEYYWDSAARQRQKTDAEYADDLLGFIGGDRSAQVIIDPSASSFKTELRNRGLRVADADNRVRDGISTMAVLIGGRKLLAERSRCRCFMREIHSYVWDEKARQHGIELPLKERDHAMDACRYLCLTKTGRWRRC